MNRFLILIALLIAGCGVKNQTSKSPKSTSTHVPDHSLGGLIFDRADHSDGYGEESMTVYFKETGNQHHNLKTNDGNDPSHFEVAGKDGVWHTAETTFIVYGNHIIAKSEMVKEPIHVRMTNSNVVNGSGMTAQSFSTLK